MDASAGKMRETTIAQIPLSVDTKRGSGQTIRPRCSPPAAQLLGRLAFRYFRRASPAGVEIEELFLTVTLKRLSSIADTR
jgi:hypothetical protein